MVQSLWPRERILPLFFVPGSDSVGECTKEFPIKQEGKKKKERNKNNSGINSQLVIRDSRKCWGLQKMDFFFLLLLWKLGNVWKWKNVANLWVWKLKKCFEFVGSKIWRMVGDVDWEYEEILWISSSENWIKVASILVQTNWRRVSWGVENSKENCEINSKNKINLSSRAHGLRSLL